MVKLIIATRRHRYIDPNDESDIDFGKSHSLWQVPSVNTKQKAAIIGLVDCTFDIISALALLYGVDFQSTDITSYLITLGTLIGFSEEIIELILEIILMVIDYISNRNDNKKLQFWFISIIGTIEIIAALVEVSISVHVINQIETDNYTVQNAMQFSLYFLMGFIILLAMWYVGETHPRCMGGCCHCVSSRIVPKEYMNGSYKSESKCKLLTLQELTIIIIIIICCQVYCISSDHMLYILLESKKIQLILTENIIII